MDFAIFPFKVSFSNRIIYTTFHSLLQEQFCEKTPEYREKPGKAAQNSCGREKAGV